VCALRIMRKFFIYLTLISILVTTTPSLRGVAEGNSEAIPLRGGFALSALAVKAAANQENLARVARIQKIVEAKKQELDEWFSTEFPDMEKHPDYDRAMERMDKLVDLAQLTLDRMPEYFDQIAGEILDPLLEYDAFHVNYILASTLSDWQEFLFTFIEEGEPLMIAQQLGNMTGIIEQWELARQFYYLGVLPIVIESKYQLSDDERTALDKAASIIASSGWFDLPGHELMKTESVIVQNITEDPTKVSCLDLEVNRMIINRADEINPLIIADGIIHENHHNVVNDSDRYMKIAWVDNVNLSLKTDADNIVKLWVPDEDATEVSASFLLGELEAYGCSGEFGFLMLSDLSLNAEQRKIVLEELELFYHLMIAQEAIRLLDVQNKLGCLTEDLEQWLIEMKNLWHKKLSAKIRKLWIEHIEQLLVSREVVEREKAHFFITESLQLDKGHRQRYLAIFKEAIKTETDPDILQSVASNWQYVPHNIRRLAQQREVDLNPSGPLKFLRRTPTTSP